MDYWVVVCLAVGIVGGVAFWARSYFSAGRTVTKSLDAIIRDASDAFAKQKIGHPVFDAAFSSFIFDYSVQSLKGVDGGLEQLRNDLPENTDGTRDLSVVDGQNLMRLIFTAGSYLGEVIRRNSDQSFQWKEFEGLTEEEKQIVGGAKGMSNFIVLSAGMSDVSVALPMNRIGRLLINGNEDSTHWFAVSIIKRAAV